MYDVPLRDIGVQSLTQTVKTIFSEKTIFLFTSIALFVLNTRIILQAIGSCNGKFTRQIVQNNILHDDVKLKGKNRWNTKKNCMLFNCSIYALFIW